MRTHDVVDPLSHANRLSDFHSIFDWAFRAFWVIRVHVVDTLGQASLLPLTDKPLLGLSFKFR